jgi:hypothetical protein
MVEALESLGISYRISGSVASSAYGIARATLDLDIVADLHPDQIRDLVTRLEDAFYIDEERVRDAVARTSSFSAIHLATMLKIDVFILRRSAYDAMAFQRGREDTLEEREGGRSFMLMSPEDVIVSKLRCYEMGGCVSERQWHDILGVLKVQGESLDRPYLHRWAAELGLASLLQRACEEAGFSQPT